MSRRRRLDIELVRRGLTASRAQAAELIEAGRVLVNGSSADKSSRQVDPGDAVVVDGPPARFVSRGGEKLEGALLHFGLNVEQLRVLDAGASTGGFSDCLLQRGAAHVVALDVGHGQLHPKIRNHPRVHVIERCNVRHIGPRDIDGEVDLVVADLSFISLKSVIPALVGVVTPGGSLVLLVKPQFEAGRSEVSKGRGIIKDPAVHARIRLEIEDSLRSSGGEPMGWVDSPIVGAEGNREFLVHATAPEKGRGT